MPLSGIIWEEKSRKYVTSVSAFSCRLLQLAQGGIPGTSEFGVFGYLLLIFVVPRLPPHPSGGPSKLSRSLVHCPVSYVNYTQLENYILCLDRRDKNSIQRGIERCNTTPRAACISTLCNISDKINTCLNYMSRKYTSYHTEQDTSRSQNLHYVLYRYLRFKKQRDKGNGVYIILLCLTVFVQNEQCRISHK